VRRVLLTLASICFGAACLFFAWYTVRLVWVNLYTADVARHRQMGMYVGAVAFPVAALLFGYVSRRCWLAGLRARMSAPTPPAG